MNNKSAAEERRMEDFLEYHPQIWKRDDVANFLRYCEEVFDLPKFDMDIFQLNGRALCMLTKNDFLKRIPEAGDVIYNMLQTLINKSETMHEKPPIKSIIGNSDSDEDNSLSQHFFNANSRSIHREKFGSTSGLSSGISTASSNFTPVKRKRIKEKT